MEFLPCPYNFLRTTILFKTFQVSRKRKRNREDAQNSYDKKKRIRDENETFFKSQKLTHENLLNQNILNEAHFRTAVKLVLRPCFSNLRIIKVYYTNCSSEQVFRCLADFERDKADIITEKDNLKRRDMNLAKLKTRMDETEKVYDDAQADLDNKKVSR